MTRFIQMRFAHILYKHNVHKFPSFLSALAYVCANWDGLKEQVHVRLLWQPRVMRRLKLKSIRKENT